MRVGVPLRLPDRVSPLPGSSAVQSGGIGASGLEEPSILSTLVLPALNLEDLPDKVKWSREELQSALKGISLIPHTQLTVGEALGKGTYAMVYRGVRRVKRKSVPVAVKRLHELPVEQLAAFSPRAQKELHCAVSRKFFDEMKMLAKARHASIVALHGLCITADLSLALVMDLMERSLFDELHPGGDYHAELIDPLPLARVVDIARACARGLAFLHDNLRVAHRDIKSLNILLAKDGAAKISDFGLSREVLTAAPMTRAGSLLWAAPELLKGLKYDTSCDQWSFAVVIWEMLTGQMPYKGMRSGDIAREVALGTHRLPLPSRGPKPLLRIMALCFNGQPEGRPKFREIVSSLDAVANKLAQATDSAKS